MQSINDKNVVHRTTHDDNTLSSPHTTSSIDKDGHTGGPGPVAASGNIQADTGLDALAEPCRSASSAICECAHVQTAERVPRTCPSPARVLVATGPRRRGRGRDIAQRARRFNVAERLSDNSRNERCCFGSVPCPFGPRRVHRMSPARVQPRGVQTQTEAVGGD